MNINALALLLLDFAKQNSKISPAARAEGTAGARGAAGTPKNAAKILNTGPLPERAPASEAKQAPEQPAQPPAFAPLPLRSALFPEARFFARVGKEKPGSNAGAQQVAELFICLVTENLGRIWVALFCRKDFLSVKYFTSNSAASKTLRENFPSLREDLIEAGFKEVSLSSQTRAELGAIADGLLPRFERHLLDQRI